VPGDERGASSVLAVALMMGFVAAAAVSLFVVGSATVAETTETTQERQIETAFQELDKDVSSVAFKREAYRETEFAIQSETAAFRQTDAGRITVSADGTEIVNQSIGALVYETDDTTIAYQAGGVWRGTGEDARLESSPPVNYRDGSLTFPIPALTGDETVTSGTLGLKKVETQAPINDQGYIEGELVTLEITSEYYMGWAEYFRTQTNDVAVSVDHSPPGPTGTVTVKLGRPVANGNFQNGVMATGGGVTLDNGNAEVNGDVSATGEITDNTDGIDGETNEDIESDLYELDEAIDRKVEKAEDVVSNGSDDSIESLDVESASNPVTAGTYYDDDGIDLDDDVTFDVSSGNVTLIVDGDLEIEGDLDVTGTSSGHAVRIYSTGDFGISNAHVGASESDGAEHLQVYGTSDMTFAMTGGASTHLVGTVYAPRNEPVLDDGDSNPAVLGGGGNHCDGWDMCVATGSSAVTGAVVGGPMYVGQSTTIEYDESLSSVEPTLQLEEGVLPPPITFLKVAVHRVEVNASNVVATPNAQFVNPNAVGGDATATSPSTGTAPAALGTDGARAQS
jgi:hypothetical protein